MSYKEDGKELENYSGFTGNGFTAFPELYETNKAVGGVTTWETGRIEDKILELDGFLQTEVPMPRARITASRIINHLMFELDIRGENRLDYLRKRHEDEQCDGA